MNRSTIVMALSAIAAASASQPAAAQKATQYVAPVVVPPAPPPPPPPPPVTRALLPGRWQLDGARYVWVKSQTRPRVVQERPLILGQNVWKDGRWVFVPTHYAPPW